MAEAKAHKIRGQKSREAIIAAAGEIYAEFGYSGSSLAMISTKVGITQAGLLHHFGSKEHLLVSVLDQHRIVETERHAGLDGAIGFDVIDMFMERYYDGLSQLIWVRLFAALHRESMLTDNPARQYMEERYDRLRDQLVGGLERGIAAGTVRSDVDLVNSVNVLIAAADGYGIQMILDESVDVRAGIGALVEMLRDRISI